MKKVVSMLLILALFAFIFCGCESKSDEMMIADRMNTFLKAYNTGDLEGALACLDAKTRNTYQAALNVGNQLIGLTGFSADISDLFSLGIGLSGTECALMLENLTITGKSDTQAVVSATLTYQDGQSSYGEEVSFTLVKEDGDWYIRG